MSWTKKSFDINTNYEALKSIKESASDIEKLCESMFLKVDMFISGVKVTEVQKERIRKSVSKINEGLSKIRTKD